MPVSTPGWGDVQGSASGLGNELLDLWGYIGNPGEFFGESSKDRAWYDRLGDPAGLFAKGGLLGPTPSIDWEFMPYQYDPEFAAALQNQAMGRGGPSVAEQQLMAGLDQTSKQAQAIAATQRGLDPAMAARMGAATASQLGLQTNQAAAALRAQEQMSAQQRYMQLEQIRAQQEAQRNALELQRATQEQQNKQQGLGSKLGGIGSAISMIASDENAKDGIAPLQWDDVQEFLRGLRPSTYRYIDPEKPGRRDGPQVGVIAQGIYNTRIGQTFVEPTPDGLVLNAHGAISALLAVVGVMGQRIDALEAAQEAPRTH